MASLAVTTADEAVLELDFLHAHGANDSLVGLGDFGDLRFFQNISFFPFGKI
jgi:hypothetical protein